MSQSDIKKLPGARKSKVPGFITPQLAATPNNNNTRYPHYYYYLHNKQPVTLPIHWPRLEASSCR